MQFRKLRLQGFKSFVDPTEMTIEPGLTGVVGPNGCGKSNLLEALRWVMGESRAKAMRGAGMDDVIFAGSGVRPPRNSASVALVIDNDRRLAPVPFAEQPEIEISRRITREIGSAYTVNGKTVRARDVTMLFADASSGAQSPSLVRQGQIGELIAARPTARRRILEEAAGIAGLYQRRHEAELKLSAAEANLARVQELIDGLDGQIRSLGRQAAQARRYRTLSEGLRRAEAILLQRRWVDADTAALAAETALNTALAAAASAEAGARDATRGREAPEAALGPLREEAMVAAAVLQRLRIGQDQLGREQAEAEARGAALTARVTELVADAEREEALRFEAVEGGTRLTEEAERLRRAHEGHPEREAAAEAAEAKATEALAAAEKAYEQAAGDAARLEAERQTAEQAAQRARSSLSAAEGDCARLRTEAESVTQAVDKATMTAEQADAAAEAARNAAKTAEQGLIDAESRRTEAEAAASESRAALSSATGREAAIASEVTAIEDLLSRDTVGSGGVADMLGVEPGFEAALAAALGDDLLSPIDPPPGSAGWGGATPDGVPAALPAGATPLSDVVTAPNALGARLAAVGVVAQADGAALHAGLARGVRLVSREGDLWRWDGFRRPASDAPSAAARRLELRNRLAALKHDAAEALGALEHARAANAAAAETLATASAADAAAHKGRADASRVESETARQAARAASEAETLSARLSRLRETLTSREQERIEAETNLHKAEQSLGQLGDASAARTARDAAHAALGEARGATMTARGALESLRRDAQGRERRLLAIRREARAWEERGAAAKARGEDLAGRLTDARREAEQAADAPRDFAARAKTLASEIQAAEARSETAATALAAGEASVREAEAAERQAERRASEARELRSRREAEAEAALARREETAQTIREALTLAPEALADETGLGPDALPTADAAEAEVQKLRRQRDALGAVNLRAEADAEELTVERDGLTAEREDLEAAIAKLRTGVRGLNREGRERLLAAFDEVNARFGELFRHLFGGGEARLILVDSEDPLEAGLEILCQPPGKKLSTLSLLSGGEQTLTALSLIFAVFLCNPAPICVLDEVDAPLDDANVLRFCALLDEMVRQTSTRFLIITHHAITMSRMDRLYGVTMMEQGVSRLVSVDLTRAEELVDG